MKKEFFTSAMGVVGLILFGTCFGLFYSTVHEQKIQASATDRSGNVIMATGPVFIRINSSSVNNGQGGVVNNTNYSALEAVYTLDQNTGRLTAGVLARESQSFQGLYQADLNAGLASVLGAGGGKTSMPQGPRYTMVTGEITVPNQGGAQWQVPQGIVYVHEQSTGYVMVYTIPWTSDWTSGRKSHSELILWTAYQFTDPYTPETE